MNRSTTMPLARATFREDALASIGARLRAYEHMESEKSPVLEETLVTVTPADEISWSGAYCWAAPIFFDDGPIRMATNTRYDDIVEFYKTGKESWVLKGFSVPLTEINKSWYVASESRAYLTDPDGHAFPESDWTALFPLDGTHGITGELTWTRFEHETPPDSMTQLDRGELFAAFLAGLRAGDVDAVMACFSATAVAATRAYAGYDEIFVGLQSKEEIAQYFERLFAAYRIRDVSTTLMVNRNWYLIAELAWEVEDRATGEPATFSTVDQLHIGAAGKFWVRIGFGTLVVAA